MRGIERAGYLAHARGPLFRRRVTEAADIIANVIADHPGAWAVGCSGGKDSTALLDLCVGVGWRGYVFYFTYPETPEANTVQVTRLAEKYGLPVHTFIVPGAWDVYAEVGHFFARPETRAERRATNAMLRGYKRIANEQATTAGYAGQFWGLRSAESPLRGMMLSQKGNCYRAEGRSCWTCCPLVHWTARDVWAYLVSRDLPWLPRYDRSEDRECERSEITWLAAESLWRRGQGQRLRMEDPAAWRAIAQRFDVPDGEWMKWS